MSFLSLFRLSRPWAGEKYQKRNVFEPRRTQREQEGTEETGYRLAEVEGAAHALALVPFRGDTTDGIGILLPDIDILSLLPLLGHRAGGRGS